MTPHPYHNPPPTLKKAVEYNIKKETDTHDL